MKGTCQFCGCTDAAACEGGCYWVDDAEDLCHRCAAGAAVASILLAVIGQLPRDHALPSTPIKGHRLEGLPDDLRRPLAMGGRAALEAVPSDAEEDLAEMVAQVKGLSDALEARYPGRMADFERRALSLRDLVLELIDDAAPRVRLN